jgi:hypothetical protein
MFDLSVLPCALRLQCVLPGNITAANGSEDHSAGYRPDVCRLLSLGVDQRAIFTNAACATWYTVMWKVTTVDTRTKQSVVRRLTRGDERTR